MAWCFLAHCGALLRFATEDADKERQSFLFSLNQFGVAWVFYVVSLHGRRKKKSPAQAFLYCVIIDHHKYFMLCVYMSHCELLFV